jgi:hypothetical protein
MSNEAKVTSSNLPFLSLCGHVKPKKKKKTFFFFWDMFIQEKRKREFELTITLKHIQKDKRKRSEYKNRILLGKKKILTFTRSIIIIIIVIISKPQEVLLVSHHVLAKVPSLLSLKYSLLSLFFFSLITHFFHFER